MVRLLYAACRDVARPVVASVDVGRCVSNEPSIALTNPTALCIWWGLHRLWTLRCQAVVRGMDVGTVAVVMSFGVTFPEARAWFTNTEQREEAYIEERLSIWFCLHRQQMLGEDPAVNDARSRALRRAVTTVGQQEAQERRAKRKRQENARQRKRERETTDAKGRLGLGVARAGAMDVSPGRATARATHRGGVEAVHDRRLDGDSGRGRANGGVTAAARIDVTVVHISNDVTRQWGGPHGASANWPNRRRAPGF